MWMNEAEMDSILIRQKDTIIAMCNRGEIKEASAALDTVRELWLKCRYGYKVEEIVRRVNIETGTQENLIKVERTSTDGRLYARFKGTFKSYPADIDLNHAQTVAGYAPQGYGHPSQIKVTNDDNGIYLATWECMGSCD